MSTDTRTIRAFGWISSMLAASMGVEARAATAISIVTPAGGESWAADTTVAITWDVTEPTDYVDIYLERGGQWYTSIGYAPMAEGQLDWEICPSLGDADDYSIRIVGCDAAGGPVEAVSGMFAVTDSLPQPALTITWPLGGETWHVVGYRQTITWDAADPSGHVYVDLLRGGQLVHEIGYAAVDAGRFDWTPCMLVGDGDDYSIRLSMDACGPGAEANSGLFTIAGSSPAPTLTVTAPAAGAVWPGGATRQIRWVSSNASGYVRLDLYRDGLWYRYLGYMGGGGWGVTYAGVDWPIDSRIGDGATYTIRLASPDACGEVIEAFSAPFGVRTTDEDRDGDVDLDDFRGFLDCFNGPNRPPHDPVPFSGACVGFDQDADGDVDLMDFANFQACFNGYNRPPRCP